MLYYRDSIYTIFPSNKSGPEIKEDLARIYHGWIKKISQKNKYTAFTYPYVCDLINMEETSNLLWPTFTHCI